MKLNQIITSLLENDLYKWSMGQVIFHQFSDYTTTWVFKCRNKNVFFTPEMVEEIKEQIKAYCELRYTEDELDYLRNIKWIKGSYVDFLRLWHPRYEDFTITTDDECGLAIETNGSWLNTSVYETPVLAIVNEVYFRMKYNYNELIESFKQRLEEKVQKLEKGQLYIANFSEFGFRRRLSREAEEYAVKRLATAKYCSSTFVGTSNVYLAKKFGVKPVGTMAHEFCMIVGQSNPKHNVAYSNHYMLSSWVKEYGVMNGIALTDTITTDCFLLDFDDVFCKIFDGVRHDSSDPILWGEKMIAHYEKMGVDAKTKTLLFSDSLDFKEADRIFRHFSGRARCAFGIGTFLSNDVADLKTGEKIPALNIVMKPIMANLTPIAKLSDCDGKNMCRDQEYIDYLKRCIDWRMEHEN